MAGIGDYDSKSKGNRGFKMKNPMSQIANTKSHGTNANFAKSGVNMNNMKDSPMEWAWLGTAAKAVGGAIKTGAKKLIGKGVAKGAVKGAAKNVAKEAVKKGAKEAVKKGAKEAIKKGAGEAAKTTMGDRIKEQAIGAARDVVTQKATDALTPKEKEHVNPTAGFNVQFGNK